MEVAELEATGESFTELQAFLMGASPLPFRCFINRFVRFAAPKAVFPKPCASQERGISLQAFFGLQAGEVAVISVCVEKGA